MWEHRLWFVVGAFVSHILVERLFIELRSVVEETLSVWIISLAVVSFIT
jgi:hypothetical protein